MNIRFWTEAVSGVVLGCVALAIAFAVPSVPVLVLAFAVALLLARLGFVTWKARARAATQDREHRLLLEGVQQYPMPYALYDEHDQLLVWNQAYESIYARTFTRLSGALEGRKLRYADLVRDNASETLSGVELEDYVRKRVSEQRRSAVGVFDREYPGIGWFRVSKHITPSGGVAGFAIDINELKRREAELLREVEQRKQLEVRIRKIANTDELTGIANRRFFIEQSVEAFARSVRESSALTLLVVDVDHFKQVNDTFGHATGDEVLVTMASAIDCALTNDEELLGRLGGEEFAILLPGRALGTARELAERICELTRMLSFVSDSRNFTISVSVGLAQRSDCDRNIADLLKRADEALYVAKANGRDRVELASVEDQSLASTTTLQGQSGRRAAR